LRIKKAATEIVAAYARVRRFRACHSGNG